MRILITGASGYVGSHLVPTLLQAGHEVRAWVHSRPERLPAHPRLKVEVADLGRGRELNLPVEPLDAVVWLAQAPGYRDFPASTVPLVSVNLLGLAQVLEHARRAGARQFLYASTGNVYQPALTPLREDSPVEGAGLYPWSKLAGERLVAQYGAFFTATSGRIFGIYGPGQANALVPNLIGKVQRGEEVFLEGSPTDPGDGGLEWTPCHVRDAAHALARLLELNWPGRVINLAGPEAISIAGLVRRAAAELGVEPRFRRQPGHRAGNLLADSALLREVLGEHAFVPLEDGLRETIQTTRQARAA